MMDLRAIKFNSRPAAFIIDSHCGITEENTAICTKTNICIV